MMTWKQTIQDALERPYTPTLVFGVGSRIGSGASFVTNSLVEELKAFGYTVHKIKITKDVLGDDKAITDWLGAGADHNPNRFDRTPAAFEKQLARFGLNASKLSEKAQRVLVLQQVGSLLRKKYHPSFLAACCINLIAKGLEEDNVLTLRENRVAYVIDSLKNPAEAELLRTVFGSAFFMVGVVADDAVQKRRLTEQKQFTSEEYAAISEIDSGEPDDFGQQATETILCADYFFENNFDKETKIKAECARLLNLIFESSIETPRKDEDGMHMAFMAADMSACLSRQVGASIIKIDGSVLATGHNDVPQFGGGLYSSESKSDNRCFAKSRMCHNDHEKRLLADEVVEILKKQTTGLTDKQVRELRAALLRESRLRTLIEFSRAVHAEMDALISVARNAKPGLVGATMFVTTFPCHNCARHIIDAGIHRVVFLEPYSKSLAHRLHGDAINNPLEDPHPNKVSFVNYGGVSPRRYSEWFSKNSSRKDKEGKLIPKSQFKDTMLPLTPESADTLEKQLDSFQAWFMRILNKPKQALPLVGTDQAPAQSEVKISESKDVG